MNNRRYLFTYEDEDVKISKEIKNVDSTLTDLCEEFSGFLKSCGYHFNGTIGVLDEE